MVAPWALAQHSLLLLQLVAGQPFPASQDKPAPPRFSFSAGPMARAWSLVQPGIPAAAKSAVNLPPDQGQVTSKSEVWSQWARAVAQCSTPGPASSAARMWLAAFARLQNRDDDAWEHLSHAGGEAAALSQVLPMLVPGAARSELERGAWPVLDDGALLAPALPPPAGAASEVVLGTGRPRRGWASCEGFRVGAATLSLRVTVESDGVQVELGHLAGGPARVRVLLPEAPDFELSVEYVDWVRQEGPRAPRDVALEPGGEPVVLFGRWRPRKIEWPTQLPRGPSAQLDGPGILIQAAQGDDLSGPARGLSELLGRAVQPLAVRPGAQREPWAGIVVDLSDPVEKKRKLAGIIGLAERFALAAAR